jgi:hypothetical protein
MRIFADFKSFQLVIHVQSESPSMFIPILSYNNEFI